MKVCAVYHFHIDLNLNKVSFFDIGTTTDFFSSSDTANINSHLDSKLKPLIKVLKKHPKAKILVYFSGCFLELLEKNSSLFKEIRDLVKRGSMELIAGPYFNSLSSIFSAHLFRYELKAQQAMLFKLFELKPTGFINSAALFADNLLPELQKMGIQQAIVPRIAWYQGANLDQRVVNSVNKKISLVLIGDSYESNSKTTNLQIISLDGMTDGFDFLKNSAIKWLGLSDLLKQIPKTAVYSLPQTVVDNSSGYSLLSLAGNSLQRDYLRRLRIVGNAAEGTKDKSLLRTLLSLASLNRLRLISNSTPSEQRYENYIGLVNILSSIELLLRLPGNQNPTA